MKDNKVSRCVSVDTILLFLPLVAKEIIENEK